MPSKVRGNHFVVPTATAIKQAWKLCDGSVREYQTLKRHGLKSMYWPAGTEGGKPGEELDWDWIKGLESKHIGEIRVDERINDHRNVRIIFFKARLILPDDPLVRMWLLTVFPKDHQRFTSKELEVFGAMRDLIVNRFYGGSSLA